MAEDRCICCGEIVPEGRMVCPNCEKQKPMKNLSHGEMVQIAEGKKNKTPRYIDANKLIDLATHEGAYGYVDVHDICNVPTADVVAVVRCRDCKWNGDDCTWCTKPDLVLDGDYISCLRIEPNWFCADGKRKEKTDG